jgi:hypothetical protein
MLALKKISNLILGTNTVGLKVSKEAETVLL